MSLKLIAFILTILVFMSCSQKKQLSYMPATDEAVPVRLISLSSERTAAKVIVSGYLSTEDQIRLSFKTGGLLEKVYVKEGDRVKKGQLLASIRPTEINALAAQASLALQKAERDYLRAKALYADSVATLEQLQNSRTAFEVSKQQVAQATFNQGFIRLVAPQDGIILRKLKSDGELCEPGGPVVVLGSLTDKQGWILSSSVSDKDWSLLTEGDTTMVAIEAFPHKQFLAKLTEKAIAADPVNGGFRVELSVLMDGVEPATGMFGKALIHSRMQGSGYRIPYEALIEANGRKAVVFVSNDGRSVRRVEVEIDELSDNQVRVVAGLDGYTYLVTSGSPYLHDGSLIRVQK